MPMNSWGWSEHWAHEAGALGATPSDVARVIAQERARWMIQCADATHEARTVAGRPMDPLPVVGDWVVVEPGPTVTDPWSVHRVLPRRSAIARGGAGDGHALQVLAANVDVVWIVQGLDTPPNLRRLERYLAVAWESGALPEVVLTKADLAATLDEALAAVRAIAPGVPVHAVRVDDSASVDALRRTLRPGSTICLLGPSGAGKSTLVNALAGEQLARVGAVREGDRRGRHTTTHRALFALPGGALLLDSPGLRELRVWTLDEGLASTFPEIEALAASCRFRDCRHEEEPECAVRAALEAGALDADRLASYRKLQAEATFEERRHDPLARAAAVAEHKTALKTLKHHPKYRA